MKSSHLKIYKAIIERSKDAYWAYIPELEGVSGVGDTVQEAKQSMLDGLGLQLELGNLSIQEFLIEKRIMDFNVIDGHITLIITPPQAKKK
jgi:predicted RNase H-like HicB family nuclease